MPNDEFQLVSTKRGTKLRKQGTRASAVLPRISCEIDECSISQETAIRRITSAKQDIITSDFYSSILVGFKQGLDLLGNPTVKEIVCYGLGHFAECMLSRFQFGLLIALKEHFNLEAFVYDPIFYQLERELLTTFGFKLIEDNEEGKRLISATTLAFFPHCPKQLTNNFLWSNWGLGLKNCIILGNSFTNIIESLPKRILRDSAKFILNIHAHTEEIGVVNSFKYTDIFNDIAIHVFPENKLRLIAQDLWDLRDEPIYCEDDLELITKSLTSSLQLQE